MAPEAGGGASRSPSRSITGTSHGPYEPARGCPSGRCGCARAPLPHADPARHRGSGTLDPAVERRLERLFERGVVRAAAETGSTVMDGGTASGVMTVLGQAVAASDASAPSLGVAPAGKVTFEADEHHRSAGTTKLEPNHTNFILANSDEWGGETSLLFEALDELSTARPAVAVLAGGGRTRSTRSVSPSNGGCGSS